MLRRLERPFVASPSDHGDELWEVPEGGENPIRMLEHVESVAGHRQSCAGITPRRTVAMLVEGHMDAIQQRRQTTRTQSTMDAIHG